jgi:hypothetical protein
MSPQTVSQTESLPFDDWLAAVDSVINEEILDCHPRAWVEDVITYNWLRAVTRRFRKVTIEDVALPFTISWDAYKADGPVETKYGDIGIIVTSHLSVNGKAALSTGVGFLEAKRIDEKRRYSNMVWDQLRHEAANISGHRVLLYDYVSVDDASLNLQGLGFCGHLKSSPYRDVHASVVITQQVLAVQDRSRSVAGLGVPLGYQLCARYLRGLDLDYTLDRAEIFDSIPGRARFLIVANIQAAGTTTVTGGTPLPQGYSPITGDPVDAVTEVGESWLDPTGEIDDGLGLLGLRDQFGRSPLLRRHPEIDAILDEGEEGDEGEEREEGGELVLA